MLEINTFSIAARCSRTGQLGVAVSTAVPGVGSMCPFGEARTGAISTQSWVNPYLGIDGLKLLKAGATAQQALEKLMDADPGRDLRQLGIVDAQGNSAAWTGQKCTGWCGHITGSNFAIQGNMLVGEATLTSMVQAFQGTAALDLADRLVGVLEAGQTAGGDKRGRQSASLLVYDVEEYPLLRLAVEDHPQPVAELRRVYGVARRQLLPFVMGMPSRRDPMRHLPDEVTEMLLLAPQDRPQS
jgi:uncharacterized Ntn-hydrolase superfamily protein